MQPPVRKVSDEIQELDEAETNSRTKEDSHNDELEGLAGTDNESK